MKYTINIHEFSFNKIKNGSRKIAIHLFDKHTQKIKINDDTESEPYIALIKRLAVKDKLDFDTAKVLISEYKKVKGENDK